MGTRWLSTLAWTALVASSLTFGCVPPVVQHEVRVAGTPAHIEGPALVVLPRTCLLDHDIYGEHGPKRGRGARTSLELRHALDSMVAGVRYSPLPVGSCSPPPDLSSDPGRLLDLRASNDLLRLMRERGAKHVVVIQIKATLVCADATGSALYAGGGVAMDTPYVVRDSCDEEQIALSALVFGADGAAVWAASRRIEPGARADKAVQRLLRRVPVKVPLRSPSDRQAPPCRLEEHGVVNCGGARR